MDLKTGELYAAKIMRKRRVARGVAAEDIGRYLNYKLCDKTADRSKRLNVLFQLEKQDY